MKTLLDTEDLVKDEDLVSSVGGGGPVQQGDTQQAAELLGDMTGSLSFVECVGKRFCHST